MENKRDCSGRLLTKFTALTASSKTVFNSADIVFVASASLCRQQWTAVISGATALTLFATPLSLPTIACAPSVLSPTHLVQSISLETTNAFRDSKMVSAVVRDGKGLQNKTSSCISPSNSYLTKQSKCAKLTMSVDSSIWRA